MGNLNEDIPLLSGQKCRPMSVVSGGMFVRIFQEVPWGGASNDSGGCRQGQFSAFSLAIFSESLEMRPALLYYDKQSIVGFSVIPKCVTLNDLEQLFRVKFCFRAGFWLAPILAGFGFGRFLVFGCFWLAPTVRFSKNNCRKTNKDILILSAAQVFGRDSTFWQYEVCADSRSGSLKRRR